MPRSALRFFLVSLVFGLCFLGLRSSAFADTTPYRSASTVTSLGTPPYIGLNNCSETDGFTCDRALASSYGDLDLRNFGDFAIPDGSVITYVRIRVTGKVQTPSLAPFVAVSRVSSQGEFFESCQSPSDRWRMFVLRSPVITTYEAVTPLTNGYLNQCLTLSNIKTNNFIFRIHYASGFPWSANIDNFEVAFDYTPAPTPSPSPTPTPPEPFLDLPWNYEEEGKKFEDVAINPASFFDHQYPLQNVACCIQNIIRYDGQSKNLFYKSHNGYDYGSQNGVFLNTPVLAAASGWATFKPESQSGGAGNVIKIDHGNKYQTWYEHLAGDDLIISNTTGKVYVNKGDKIGKVGMTGNTTGPHIHFSVFKDSNDNGDFNDDIPWGAVDPLGWEGDYDDPWTLFESNGRNGTQSHNLFLARAPKKEEEIPVTGGEVTLGDIIIDVLGNTFNTGVNIFLDYGPFESSGVLKSIKPSFFINAFDSFGQEITQLLQPATITYSYSDADLFNIDEGTLKIYYFNEETGQWETLPSLIDAINDTVSTQTTHFSQFALMGEVKDLIPPTTEVIVSGDEGEDGWYRSDISVQLLGHDNEGGVGMQYTLYALNGSDWHEYEDPIPFSNEGLHTITYESYDKAENKAERKTITFIIDKTPPIASISANPSILWPPNGKLVPVTIGGSIEESNFLTKSFTIIDEYGEITPAVNDFGETIMLEAKRKGSDKNGRMYIISVEAIDLAGNISTAAAEVVVPHDQGEK